MTCSVIKFVCLSRKDTAGTIAQVAQNNAALLSICVQKVRCK